MAITIDGKTYRNLQEQVAKNTDDIKLLKETSVDRYSNEEIDEKFQEKLTAGFGLTISDNTISKDKQYIHRISIENSTQKYFCNFWIKTEDNTPIADMHELAMLISSYYSTQSIAASGIIIYNNAVYFIRNVYDDQGAIGATAYDSSFEEESFTLSSTGATINDLVETI